MSKNTTTYVISANDQVVSEGHSKKSVALQIANDLRDAERVEVVVTTSNGKEVARIAAPRTIAMSAPYTRHEVAAERSEAEYINGKRVAYTRVRVGFALLDAARGEYTIYDLVTKREVGDLEVATTREAGRWFADEARAFRASLEAAQA